MRQFEWRNAERIGSENRNSDLIFYFVKASVKGLRPIEFLAVLPFESELSTSNSSAFTVSQKEIFENRIAHENQAKKKETKTKMILEYLAKMSSKKEPNDYN